MFRAFALWLFAFFAAYALAQTSPRGAFSFRRVEVTDCLDSVPSAEAAGIVAPYKAKVDSLMSPALGLSRVCMSASRPESLLGNWVADVLVEGGTATGLDPADMGLINIGALRSNMPEGIVRQGDIMLIAPFEDCIVVLELKGSRLLRLMQDIAAVGGEGVSSGVRMQITPDGRLLSATIDGAEIDPKRIYTVATIDYLAEGNDGMHALCRARKRHNIGIPLRDIMMEYVLKHRVIDSKMEGRITIAPTL